MLQRRLIPKLQFKKSSFSAKPRAVLVTTRNFDQVFEVGDPVSQAKIYQAQMADELIFLDLDAAGGVQSTIVDVIHRSAEELFMPLTVGGGVQSVADCERLLAHGADKISINSAAVSKPEFIDQASAVFGSQCVVLSIDYKIGQNGELEVFSHGGKRATGLHPVRWAQEGEARGAGEILLTSIDRDGSRQGLDFELCAQVTSLLKIPVIVSGGCGAAKHFVEGFTLGGADAVSAGTYFCFKDENPMQTRAQILNSAIPIRIER